VYNYLGFPDITINCLEWKMRRKEPRLTGNRKKDISRLEKDIAKGSVGAMSLLALLIQDEDPQRAISLFEDAAEKGNITAMVGLATMIQDSNPLRAVSLYEYAAAKGNTNATVGLAYLLRDQDPPRAISLFEQAISQGFKVSLVSHATFIQDYDPQRAMSLFEQAVAQGDETALHRLNNLSSYLTLLKADDRSNKGAVFYEQAAALHEQTSAVIASRNSSLLGIKETVELLGANKNRYCYLLFDTDAKRVFCESFSHEIKNVHSFNCSEKIRQGSVQMIGTISPSDYDHVEIDEKYLLCIIDLNKNMGKI
jgi:TPR repeat protein